MKKIKFTIGLVFICILSIFNCTNQSNNNQYNIKGLAPGVHNGIRIYLKSLNASGRAVNKDTAIVINEKFELKGTVDIPEPVFLELDGTRGRYSFYLDNSNLDVSINKDTISKSTLEGSVISKEFETYEESVKEIQIKMSGISKEYRMAWQTKDTANLKKYMEEIKSLRKEMNEVPLKYISDNPNSYVSINLVNQQLRRNPKGEMLQQLGKAYEGLSTQLKDSKQGKRISLKIKQLKKNEETRLKLRVGQVAPQFSALDPDGNSIALTDVVSKNKITIVDFWASWCKPCRKANPELVKMYNKYHDKGLGILGVSLDRSTQKDKWIQAIADDKLAWEQVSNLQYFNGPIAKMYDIRSIPYTYIIDNKGVILAKRLSGKSLEKRVKSLLNIKE